MFGSGKKSKNNKTLRFLYSEYSFFFIDISLVGVSFGKVTIIIIVIRALTTEHVCPKEAKRVRVRVYVLIKILFRNVTQPLE